ncbi:hypothetical protein [Kosakonia cowanii]
MLPSLFFTEDQKTGRIGSQLRMLITICPFYAPDRVKVHNDALVIYGKMAMTNDRYDVGLGTWAEALRSLFEDDYPEKLFRISDAEIDGLEGQSPDKWPTAGQTEINWDLSVQGRKYTIDLLHPGVLQPADCAHVDVGSMVLGKASFADFDPLLHPRFRLPDSRLWAELAPQKLGRAILHIAKGWPVSPVWLCRHEYGGFHFGGGTHRYQVLKRSGTPYFYFLAEADDIPALNTLLTVQWMRS